MKKILILLLISFLSNKVLSQVGIGTDVPNDYSSLDIESNSTGVLIPKVSLGSSSWDIKQNKNCIGCNQPNGLIVFNTGQIPVDRFGVTIPGAIALPQGLYYWNKNSITPSSSEWLLLKANSSTAGYANFSCTESYLEPQQVIIGGTPLVSGSLIKLPYTSGNGGSYQGVVLQSLGNSSVTATIESGQFNKGTGTLIMQINGLPTASQSSPNGIIFDLAPFYNLNLGFSGKSGLCNQINVGKEMKADIKTLAVMDNLRLTNDNGVSAYATQLTTPDGKFSVRAVIVSSDFNSSAGNFASDSEYGMNLQIRNNTSSNLTILGNYTYLFRGSGGNTNNAVILQPGKWSGDLNTSLDNQSTSVYAAYVGSGTNLCSGISSNNITNNCVFTYWGNPGVYAAGSPEHRIYAWTLNDGLGETTKTLYTLDFMMGSSKPLDKANLTNCPGGICKQTKVYLKIEQVTAPQ